MKRVTALFAGALVVEALLAPQTLACGDKFLVRLDRDFRTAGTPMRAAPNRATILIYRPAESGRVPANSDIDLLRRVGHDVRICDTARFCSQAVTDGAVQIVLADSRDIEALGIDPRRSRAHFLPVVSKASRQDKQVLKERYGSYFDSGAPPGKLLAMVDRILADLKSSANGPHS